MNAGIVGMIGQQPPQQSFTNFPMAGFTRVVGSNDFFSERQMNVMAAGGTYIIVQDAPSAPLDVDFTERWLPQYSHCTERDTYSRQSSLIA